MITVLYTIVILFLSTQFAEAFLNPLRPTSSSIALRKSALKPLFIKDDVLPFQSSNFSQIEDDGYEKSHNAFSTRGAFNFVKGVASKVLRPKQPGILILVRHGVCSMCTYNMYIICLFIYILSCMHMYIGVTVEL